MCSFLSVAVCILVTDLLKSRLPLAVHPFCATLLHVSSKHTISHRISVSSSLKPCHSQQPNATTQAAFTEQWTRLLLAYARHCGLFILRIEDAEVTGGGEWDEVLRNPRINRGSRLLALVLFLFPLFWSTWCGEVVSRIGMTTVCREIEVRISR